MIANARSSLFLATLVLFVPGVASADIRLPRLVSSGMVLQREAAVGIWGWADPGESVRVGFQGKKFQVKADSTGRWSISMGPYSAGGPYEMEITGKNSISLHDILVGDVWLASGQSNMEFTVGAFDGYPGVVDAEQDLSATSFPQMRLFTVERATTLEPKDDVVSSGWQSVTHESARRFSAVAYYFGRDLCKHYKVPIGLIQAVWGGTLAEAWMSKSALSPFPEIKLQTFDQKAQLYYETLQPQRYAWFRKHAEDDNGSIDQRELWADPEFDAGDWPTFTLPRPESALETDFKGFGGVLWLRKDITVSQHSAGCDWTINLGTHVNRDDTVFWNGQRIGGTAFDFGFEIPRSYTVPKSVIREGRNVIAIRVVGGSRFGFGASPVGISGIADDLKIDTCQGSLPLSGAWSYRPGADLSDFPAIEVETESRYPTHTPPTTLFNGMIHPLARYRIKGVIWYQGEANALEYRSAQYRTLFPALIEDWRREWHYDFPFLFVQLAGFGSSRLTNSPESQWELQWVQFREAQDMALSESKTGMATAIDIGNQIHIHPRDKREVGHRLALVAFRVAYGESNVVDSGPRYQSMRIEGQRARICFSNIGSGLLIKDEYGYVRGFEIAGADGLYSSALALPNGNDVVVFSESVKEPKAVRYDWSGTPDGNIYNREGLPAVPFRTDSPEYSPASRAKSTGCGAN